MSCMNCGCKPGVAAQVSAPEKNVVQAQAVQPKPKLRLPHFEKLQRAVEVGDVIKFGEWHSAPIEWQVLEVKEGKALLLSKYALACKQYHNSEENITWENCDLRKWLNGEFFQKVFKGDAVKCIVESHVPAQENPDYTTDPGNDTRDKVFLLSVEEVMKYLKKKEDRICMPLSFVKSEGALVGDNGACVWWLRSPGMYAGLAANVYYGGSADSDGNFVNYENDVVRPVCWEDMGMEK